MVCVRVCRFNVDLMLRCVRVVANTTNVSCIVANATNVSYVVANANTPHNVVANPTMNGRRTRWYNAGHSI